MMASAVHLMVNAVNTKWSFWCTWWHIQYTCWHIQYTMWGSWFTLQDMQTTWSQIQYTQVRLLKCTPVLFLMVDDGLCSTLDGYAVHPSEAPEEHPSVVPDVRWWPLQYTWWQMQYTQVRLLKYTPVLFLMLDDGLCSTPKWGSWRAP